MKKLVLLLSAVFLVASLSACAKMGPAETTKVKCPACGHEFLSTPNPELVPK